MRFLLLFVFLLFTSCAALKSGWARVTYVEGKLSPEMACTFRLNPEGDVEAVCTALRPVETDLLWKRERRRAGAGES